ncbi:MAG: hypothetical protein CBARDCOR_6462 [uncultured Caballeronia sp.]|nr:MAG: hypothetical protein CBARDCOR_6462 [uncultured Caballeronia sp.]
MQVTGGQWDMAARVFAIATLVSAGLAIICVRKYVPLAKGADGLGHVSAAAPVEMHRNTSQRKNTS